MRAFHERLNNKKHSDFFLKLHNLKEKIDLFNEVFKIEAPPRQRRKTLRAHRMSMIMQGSTMNALQSTSVNIDKVKLNE
jgi:hypothetical protein